MAMPPVPVLLLPVGADREHQVSAGTPAANIQAFAPMANIPTFGMCGTMSNPVVAAATAAKLGVFSPAPCVPATTAPWTPGAAKVMVDGQPALHSACTAMCMWGGVITITNPGNKQRDGERQLSSAWKGARGSGRRVGAAASHAGAILARMDSDELQAAEVEHQRRTAPFERESTGFGRDASLPLQRLASTIGNDAFTRVVARMRDGEGILEGGLVHPDVEGAIAAARGRGRPLDLGAAQSAGARLGDSFDDVQVHMRRPYAAALSRAVSARAFTVGNDIFFNSGEYSPGTSGGSELLTHELAHVVQQRGAPQTGALVVSQPGDAYELEADAAARGV